MTSPEPLIDIHAHFLTEHYVAAAKDAGHTTPDGMSAWPSWSLQQQLDLMDRTGIHAAILSISSPGTHFGDDHAARTLTRHVNHAGAELVKQHPQRLGLFAELPLPDVEGSLTELAYVLDELHSDGVAIKSNAHGRYLGDPGFQPLWAELDRRHAVVFVHPTSPPGWEATALGRPRSMLEFLFDTTRTVSDLLFANAFTTYPGIQWIFPHGGGALPLFADRIHLVRTGLMGLHDDPSVHQQLARLWYDTAGAPFPHHIPTLVRAFGHTRLLYGSDYCFTPPAAVTDQVAAIEKATKPPGSSWRRLTSENATRLLPRFECRTHST